MNSQATDNLALYIDGTFIAREQAPHYEVVPEEEYCSTPELARLRSVESALTGLIALAARSHDYKQDEFYFTTPRGFCYERLDGMMDESDEQAAPLIKTAHTRSSLPASNSPSLLISRQSHKSAIMNRNKSAVIALLTLAASFAAQHVSAQEAPAPSSLDAYLGRQNPQYRAQQEASREAYRNDYRAQRDPKYIAQQREAQETADRDAQAAAQQYRAAQAYREQQYAQREEQQYAYMQQNLAPQYIAQPQKKHLDRLDHYEPRTVCQPSRLLTGRDVASAWAGSSAGPQGMDCATTYVPVYR